MLLWVQISRLGRSMMILLLALLTGTVGAFHIPSLQVDTEIGGTYSETNISHSNIFQNWSQSLHLSSIGFIFNLLVLILFLLGYNRLNLKIACVSSQNQELLRDVKEWNAHRHGLKSRNQPARSGSLPNPVSTQGK